MIRSVRVINFKSLAAVEIPLGHFNCLVGMNGAGKSTVLQALDFLSTLIFMVSYAAQITDIDAGVRLKPLPVTLKSFTGRWNTKKDVNELEWVTVSETNNAYLEVERSFRGSDFEVVAKVAGAGNSTKTLVYGIEDEDILVNGVYTYRLKQVDYDGKVNYHGPIEIKVERALVGGNIKVYPNPSRGAFNVEIEASEGQSIKADLYDSTGKLISSEMIDIVSQGELVRYQNNNMILDKGMYYPSSRSSSACPCTHRAKPKFVIFGCDPPRAGRCAHGAIFGHVDARVGAVDLLGDDDLTE